MVPALFSNGVSTLHDGLVKLERNAPENRLLPLFVITLTTPPLKRPYSADTPDVSTWTSWIASSMNRALGWPSTLSLMSTPSIRNTLSYANAPLTVTWLLLGVLSVRPGATSASANGVRPVGISVNWSARRLNAPAGELTGAGRAPCTTTTSDTGASASIWSIVTAPPSDTAACRSTVDMPCISNFTV